MGAGHYRLVGRQQREPLGVQVVVGDHVVGVALGLEPVEDVGVGVEAPNARHRTHVEDRAQARAVAHAEPVRVGVIGGEAEFEVLLQERLLVAQA